MARPLCARMNVAAMRANLQTLRLPLQPRQCWAVVKANAYGHGLKAAVKGFSAADGLALIEPESAFALREQGWPKRLLLMEGVFEASELRACAQFNVDPVIHSAWQLDLLRHRDHRASVQQSKLRIWIKFNSGMNRLGFPVQNGLELIEQLRLEGFQLGAIAHFSSADAEQGDPVSELAVLNLFNAIKRIDPAIPCSFANSAASHRLIQSMTAGRSTLRPDLPEQLGADWLRFGIALYGASAFDGLDAHTFGLRPAMSLESKVIAIQRIESGDRVGYAGRFVAQRPSRIAVVAAGYADGYPRHAPDGTPLWIAGVICPLAGRVSMDMMTVDVTDCPEADVGTEVELWGEHLPVDQVASAAGTIAYQLLSGLTSRVKTEILDLTGELNQSKSSQV